MSPTVLVVLDGFGERSERRWNAVKLARTPVLDGLGAPALLEASGAAVGLPDGQIGNSEVGHLTIGAGRVVMQDLPRINRAIADGSFFTNPVLAGAMAGGGRIHVMGLTSPGGVHSHVDHGLALVELARRSGVPGERISWHAFLDGRDVPPRSAAQDIRALVSRLAPFGARVASIVGRFYAMDRDSRWERTERAYRLLVAGEGRAASDPVRAVEEAYARGESDEFVEPIVVGEDQRIGDGDVVIFFNFRADRARQLTEALAQGGFQGFVRQPPRPQIRFVCMTEYDRRFGLPVAFPSLHPHPTLGDVIAEAGLRQLRVAETEKYAHVTYFFSGGVEAPVTGEERVLVPSPRGVRTYDLAPAMNAAGVADAVVAGLDAGVPDFILCNFANPDMVGHTGVLDAAVRAVEVVDAQIGRILEAAARRGAAAVITADHGNCELMWDEASDGPHTAHTTSPVPLWVVPARPLRPAGGLVDVAPTVCALMGLAPGAGWTGRSLLLDQTS